MYSHLSSIFTGKEINKDQAMKLKMRQRTEQTSKYQEE